MNELERVWVRMYASEMKISIVEKAVVIWCDTSGVDAPFFHNKGAALDDKGFEIRLFSFHVMEPFGAFQKCSIVCLS